jgi:hypothetical protein
VTTSRFSAWTPAPTGLAADSYPAMPRVSPRRASLWPVKTTFVGLAVACMLACDSYDDVKIQQTAPPNGRVGEVYTHTFSVTRTVEDAWFIDCRHSNDQQLLPMKMTPEGVLSFEPPAPGPRELCVEYRRRDGELDVWKPTIEIAPRVGESVEELRVEIEAVRKKLAKVHAAVVAIAQPQASDCPKGLEGTAHAYDQALLASVVAGPGAKAEGPSVDIRPIGLDALRAADAQLPGISRDTIKELKAATHVVARPVVMTLPELKKEEGRFIMGTYQGFAFVVEADSAKVLCTRPLAYTSSDELEWTQFLEKQADGTLEKEEPGRFFEEIFRDFDLAGQVAVDKAIADQAPGLDLRR